MKKATAILSALLMLLSLASCTSYYNGEYDEYVPDEYTEENENPDEDEEYTDDEDFDEDEDETEKADVDEDEEKTTKKTPEKTTAKEKSTEKATEKATEAEQEEDEDAAILEYLKSNTWIGGIQFFNIIKFGDNGSVTEYEPAHSEEDDTFTVGNIAPFNSIKSYKVEDGKLYIYYTSGEYNTFNYVTKETMGSAPCSYFEGNPGKIPSDGEYFFFSPYAIPEDDFINGPDSDWLVVMHDGKF